MHVGHHLSTATSIRVTVFLLALAVIPATDTASQRTVVSDRARLMAPLRMVKPLIMLRGGSSHPDDNAGSAEQKNVLGEGDTCCLCYEETLHWAVGACGHRVVCVVCALKARLLMNSTECVICKCPQPIVVVTSSLGTLDEMDTDAMLFDTRANAFYEDANVFAEMQALQGTACKLCAAPHTTLIDLQKHLRTTHALEMCDFCVRHRRNFIGEQRLFTPTQLHQHLVREHPLCTMCKKRHYDDTQLYRHLERDHFSCHLCVRAHATEESGRRKEVEFYREYADLEEHFRSAHILCRAPECLALRYAGGTHALVCAWLMRTILHTLCSNLLLSVEVGPRYVVFASNADYRMHFVQEHAGRLQRSERSHLLSVTSQVCQPCPAIRAPGRPRGVGSMRSRGQNGRRGDGRGAARGLRRGGVAVVASRADECFARGRAPRRGRSVHRSQGDVRGTRRWGESGQCDTNDAGDGGVESMNDGMMRGINVTALRQRYAHELATSAPAGVPSDTGDRPEEAQSNEDNGEEDFPSLVPLLNDVPGWFGRDEIGEEAGDEEEGVGRGGQGSGTVGVGCRAGAGRGGGRRVGSMADQLFDLTQVAVGVADGGCSSLAAGRMDAEFPALPNASLSLPRGNGDVEGVCGQDRSAWMSKDDSAVNDLSAHIARLGVAVSVRRKKKGASGGGGGGGGGERGRNGIEKQRCPTEEFPQLPPAGPLGAGAKDRDQDCWVEEAKEVLGEDVYAEVHTSLMALRRGTVSAAQCYVSNADAFASLDCRPGLLEAVAEAALRGAANPSAGALLLREHAERRSKESRRREYMGMRQMPARAARKPSSIFPSTHCS